MTAEAAVRALDGALLRERSSEHWRECFTGAVRVEQVVTSPEAVRFELLLPTSPLDIDDFILASELETGTTDKVVLVRGGEPLPEARITGIVREGHVRADNYHVAGDEDRYRLAFVVPGAVEAPLELLVRHRDPQTSDWYEIAIAAP